jgi:hypothetical protein
VSLLPTLTPARKGDFCCKLLTTSSNGVRNGVFDSVSLGELSSVMIASCCSMFKFNRFSITAIKPAISLMKKSVRTLDCQLVPARETHRNHPMIARVICLTKTDLA